MNSQICRQSGTAPPRAQVLKSTPPGITPTQRRHLLFVLGLILIVRSPECTCACKRFSQVGL